MLGTSSKSQIFFLFYSSILFLTDCWVHPDKLVNVMNFAAIFIVFLHLNSHSPGNVPGTADETSSF